MFDIPWLAPVATALSAVAGFLLSFAWQRWWRKRDDGQKAEESRLVTVEGRLGSIERRLDVHDEREDARQQAVGALRTEQSKLAGKVDGLQEFWRTEFGALRKELRDDQVRFQGELRAELRQDQNNFETRLTTLLTTHLEQERQERQAHQQRVHDRLNGIAADQAKLLTEFVDSMVEQKAEEPP